MKTIKQKIDKRPRFGWTSKRNINLDPQKIYENRDDRFLVKSPKENIIPVVVIPLPFLSAKMRAKIRAFTNATIWPIK